MQDPTLAIRSFGFLFHIKLNWQVIGGNLPSMNQRLKLDRLEALELSRFRRSIEKKLRSLVSSGPLSISATSQQTAGLVLSRDDFVCLAQAPIEMSRKILNFDCDDAEAGTEWKSKRKKFVRSKRREKEDKKIFSRLLAPRTKANKKLFSLSPTYVNRRSDPRNAEMMKHEIHFHFFRVT